MDEEAPPVNPAEEAPKAPKYRHPIAAIFHLAFKVAALVTYLLCFFITGSFVITFISCVLFLAFDFWTVQNVTGRLLVGLRWWNEIKEDGSSKWIFESIENKSRILMSERILFWAALFISPAVWGILAVTSVLNIKNWPFLVIVGIALILGITNIVGYIKCARDSRKKLQDYARRQAVNMATEQIISSAKTTML
eukprot:TRINITY_DN762_c0_g1_i1.p1 TRINITY_DN762_c0_g1~~TRINITY_DN762_c0_g1_i1.p1  ORF type:complete len:194 (+),score=23.24 TRINITY_DN762_c0_g1_i1:16-597(+)